MGSQAAKRLSRLLVALPLRFGVFVWTFAVAGSARCHVGVRRIVSATIDEMVVENKWPESPFLIRNEKTYA